MTHEQTPPTHPLEPLSNMRRRRFLSLAAFAGTSVVAVGVAAHPAQAAPQPQPHTIDADTGWPVFPAAAPPNGYTRTYLPCDDSDYVDVPHGAQARPAGDVKVVKPPFTLAGWNRTTGGRP